MKENLSKIQFLSAVGIFGNIVSGLSTQGEILYAVLVLGSALHSECLKYK